MMMTIVILNGKSFLGDFRALYGCSDIPETSNIIILLLLRPPPPPPPPQNIINSRVISKMAEKRCKRNCPRFAKCAR
ncbi:unnamed protein product [Bathycoccus prasinos]